MTQSGATPFGRGLTQKGLQQIPLLTHNRPQIDGKLTNTRQGSGCVFTAVFVILIVVVILAGAALRLLPLSAYFSHELIVDERKNALDEILREFKSDAAKQSKTSSEIVTFQFLTWYGTSKQRIDVRQQWTGPASDARRLLHKLWMFNLRSSFYLSGNVLLMLDTSVRYFYQCSRLPKSSIEKGKWNHLKQ